MLVWRNGETRRRLDTMPFPIKSARAACWRPSGRLIAVSAPSTTRGSLPSEVHILDSSASGPKLLTHAFQARDIDGLDWSASGQLAVWDNQQIRLFTLPLHDRVQPHEIVTRDIMLPYSMLCGNTDTLRWSPDGVWLAAGAKNGAVACWHGEQRTIQHQLPPSGYPVYSLAWSRDSAYLAASFSDHHLEVWNVREKRKIAHWPDLPHVPRSISISLNGTLAVASDAPELLFGDVRGTGPATSYPGYWLASWSPTRPELATLDAQTGASLVIWEETSA